MYITVTGLVYMFFRMFHFEIFTSGSAIQLQANGIYGYFMTSRQLSRGGGVGDVLL